MVARAKSINLLLYDGTLQGVVSIEDTSWNLGEMYVAPRDSVEDILSTDACSKYGVYLLLSNENVYIGQSSDLSRRLTEHINGKDWWESVVILTTKDDSLTHSDIDYLESALIEKAISSDALDCENANKGNPRKVDKYKKVFLDQYLEEALFLMQFIGITVFSDNRGRSLSDRPSSQALTIDTMDTRMRLRFGTRAKGHAIRFLAEQGMKLGPNVSYATLQSERDEFWLNPKTDCLLQDWDILLNDNLKERLIVLRVPANDISMRSESEIGLIARSDKPDLVDLHIARNELLDRTSGVRFSQYLICEIPY